ncbi:MAG TPA: NAD-dependent epimerase, partial [Chloroflexota bacterium]|nr:NAD-dependent epimerase [Chloroflexota bacterium]
ADSDRIARRLQEIGAPVVITYPGGVWGPHDPHYGESCQEAESILRGAWPIVPTGGWPISDVRDLATLHTAVIERGRGPRRYMATAHFVRVPDVVSSVSRVTGRDLSTREVPNWTLLGPARLLDAVQRWVPVKMPFTYQGTYLVSLSHRIDDSATRREFGIEPRDIDTSIGDTIAWMVQIGRVPPRLAGRLGIQDRLHTT